ncbi:1319_t:CDS:2, partial [Cetraspora pellucida]
METEPVLLTAIRRLQNPIPQYVLGTIPAIAIIEMCAYWLSAEYFDLGGNQINYMPVGHHAKQLNPTIEQADIITNWVAEASLLDRLSSLSSLYYIF